MNILLVEDNEGDIALTQIAHKDCAMQGELAVAHDGQEALDRLYNRGDFASALKPDLVLLDLNMPRMNGKQFLDVVKTDDAMKAIPVIMLTSSQSPAEISQCYERHANCYIAKPWGLQGYVDILQELERYWDGFVVLPVHTELA